MLQQQTEKPNLFRISSELNDLISVTLLNIYPRVYKCRVGRERRTQKGKHENNKRVERKKRTKRFLIHIDECFGFYEIKQLFPCCFCLFSLLCAVLDN